MIDPMVQEEPGAAFVADSDPDCDDFERRQDETDVPYSQPELQRDTQLA